jgi:hypothetical protein
LAKTNRGHGQFIPQETSIIVGSLITSLVLLEIAGVKKTLLVQVKGTMTFLSIKRVFSSETYH